MGCAALACARRPPPKREGTGEGLELSPWHWRSREVRHDLLRDCEYRGPMLHRNFLAARTSAFQMNSAAGLETPGPHEADHGRTFALHALSRKHRALAVRAVDCELPDRSDKVFPKLGRERVHGNPIQNRQIVRREPAMSIWRRSELNRLGKQPARLLPLATDFPDRLFRTVTVKSVAELLVRHSQGAIGNSSLQRSGL